MTACINWTGYVSQHGYGLRYVRGSGYGMKDHGQRPAHRVAYEEVHGPIPSGLTVHHRCGNKACVRVDHLELLTHREHHSDRGHGKLNATKAAEIRDLCAEGWKQDDIAESYGVTVWTVYDIRRGRTWA